MEIILDRKGTGKRENDKSTVGELVVLGSMFFTIEDDFDEKKEPGKTRIPAGRYEIKLRTEGGTHVRYLTRFPEFHKGMLHLINVPNYQYVLIHCGNRAEDTEGCICIGSKKFNDNYISGSEAAYRKFYPIILKALLKKEKVFINIID